MAVARVKRKGSPSKRGRPKETTQTGPSRTGASRRSFLRWLWYGLGAVAVAELAGVVVAYLWPSNSPSADRQGTFEIGSADDFPPGSVTAFPEGRFYLARLEDGGFLAFSHRCTHLGCVVPWDAERRVFQCPCHASVFDIKGEVLEPPAPRPLDLFTVIVEEGRIAVDTSRTRRRWSFEETQVARL